MVCVYCGSETSVVNSRLKKRINIIWRRRQCISCKSVFTTEESTNYSLSWGVKDKRGKIRPFSRDKLFLSLYKACAHRKTAISDAGAVADTVIVYLLSERSEKGLDKEQIKHACLISLNRFDKAAFSHYKAYHS